MDSTSGAGPAAQTRIRQQAVVAELGQQALETDDLDQLMHDAAVAVAETLDNDYAKVLELLPGGEEVFLRQGVGWRDGLVGSATVPTDRDSQAGYTLCTEEPVIVDDLRTEERFVGPELLTSHDVVSGISVIIGSVENPWGVLGTHSTDPREFTDHDAAFVQSVANVLAATLENEKTRHELEEMYGRISDAFFALDENWRFTYLNEGAHEVINPDSRELEGTYVWEEFPAATERAFKPKYERAMYEQQTVSFEEYYPEPLDAWFEVRAYPSETGLSVYFRDVTERKERERELDLFRTLLDHSTDSVLVIDPETGRFRDVNETACDRHGYSREAFLDRTVPDIEVELPDQDAWQSFVEELRAERELTFEGRHRRNDGTTYPVEVNATYVDLETEHVLAISRDVTELRKHERRLSTLMDNVPGMVYRARNERGWPLEFASDACEGLTGYDPEALESGPIEWGTDVVVQDDRESLWNAVQAAVENGETFSETYRIETADGEIRWVRNFGRGVYDDGELANVEGIVADITERKRLERQLQRNNDQLETLFDVLPVGVVVAEADGEIVSANDTAEVIWGGEVFDVESVEAYEKYPVWWADSGERVDPKDLTLSRVLDGEEVTDPDVVEIEAFDDQRRILRAEGRPIRDESGEVVRGVVTITDVTERREYERKLEESNERLEQFAYAASHDLREPLRMVSSYLQLLEDRYEDELDADAEEFIEFAVDGAERMNAMIEGLLEYSRVETQGNPFEPVDLNVVIDDVVEDLQVRIVETDAEITASDLPTVSGDSHQLRQVFQNLLKNAIVYSGDEPPQVHVEAVRDGDTWEIAVRDEGIGIDPDDQERVFQVFQRLHTHDEQSGTGIGLALCQRIVERHSGEIRVESESGDGTTFSFTLPATST